MIRKRYSEESGNWHVDVHVNGGWVEIAEVGDEDQIDEVVANLTAWLMESIVSDEPI